MVAPGLPHGRKAGRQIGRQVGRAPVRLEANRLEAGSMQARDFWSGPWRVQCSDGVEPLTQLTWTGIRPPYITLLEELCMGLIPWSRSCFSGTLSMVESFPVGTWCLTSPRKELSDDLIAYTCLDLSEPRVFHVMPFLETALRHTLALINCQCLCLAGNKRRQGDRMLSAIC